jgi:MFS family permease
LHGFTFALLHLASMRIITDTVPRALAATAQAVYGLVGVGGATAALMLLSGWLYARFGPAGFGRWEHFAPPQSPSSGCCIGRLRRSQQRPSSARAFLEATPVTINGTKQRGPERHATFLRVAAGLGSRPVQCSMLSRGGALGVNLRKYARNRAQALTLQ